MRRLLLLLCQRLFYTMPRKSLQPQDGELTHRFGRSPPERLVGSCHGQVQIWDFPKIGVPYFGVPTKRILLFRVLY